jgi:hypothetical protein
MGAQTVAGWLVIAADALAARGAPSLTASSHATVRKLTVPKASDGDLAARPILLAHRRGGGVINLVSVWENCMNGDLQRIEPRAVSAGVSIRQLPAAFAAAACESLVRRDDATLSVQSG